MSTVVTIPRQLAPTVGQEARGAQIQTGSHFGGIGDTIAIERIAYIDNTPVIVNDSSWMPASGFVTNVIILPIGNFDIFNGFTDEGSALHLGGSSHEIFAGSIFNTYEIGNKEARTTQPAPYAEIMVEDGSASVSFMDGSDRDLVEFIGYYGVGSALLREG